MSVPRRLVRLSTEAVRHSSEHDDHTSADVHRTCDYLMEVVFPACTSPTTSVRASRSANAPSGRTLVIDERMCSVLASRPACCRRRSNHASRRGTSEVVAWTRRWCEATPVVPQNADFRPRASALCSPNGVRPRTPRARQHRDARRGQIRCRCRSRNWASMAAIWAARSFVNGSVAFGGRREAFGWCFRWDQMLQLTCPFTHYEGPLLYEQHAKRIRLVDTRACFFEQSTVFHVFSGLLHPGQSVLPV